MAQVGRVDARRGPERILWLVIDGGIYLLHNSIFEEIRLAMIKKTQTHQDDPTLVMDDQLRLEQDVIAPAVEAKKMFVYQALGPWVQIKSAA